MKTFVFTVKDGPYKELITQYVPERIEIYADTYEEAVCLAEEMYPTDELSRQLP